MDEDIPLPRHIPNISYFLEGMADYYEIMDNDERTFRIFFELDNRLRKLNADELKMITLKEFIPCNIPKLDTMVEALIEYHLNSHVYHHEY
mgnify:CR=1 FL=1